MKRHAQGECEAAPSLLSLQKNERSKIIMPDNITYEGVEITLDKPRHIRYTFAAMRIILKKYGSLQKVFGILQKMEGGDLTEESLDALSTLIYAGLVHEDESLTQGKVENLLDFRNMMPLVDAITEALGSSLPEGGEEKNSQNPA